MNSVTDKVKEVLNALNHFISDWRSSDKCTQGKLDQIIATQKIQQGQLANLTVLGLSTQAPLDKILAAVIDAPVAVSFVVVVKYADTGVILNPEGETQMNVVVGKQVIATISKIVDKFGNDATLDGLPAWGSSGDAVKSVTASADGMSAVILFSTTAKLTGQVAITGDGDPGPDQALFHSNLDFTTIADSAVEFQVSVGAPTDPSA